MQRQLPAAVQLKTARPWQPCQPPQPSHSHWHMSCQLRRTRCRHIAAHQLMDMLAPKLWRSQLILCWSRQALRGRLPYSIKQPH